MKNPTNAALVTMPPMAPVDIVRLVFEDPEKADADEVGGPKSVDVEDIKTDEPTIDGLILQGFGLIATRSCNAVILLFPTVKTPRSLSTRRYAEVKKSCPKCGMSSRLTP